MMRLISAVLFLFVVFANAQNTTTANTFAVKGKFYVSVDDVADIFLNGLKVHRGNIGQSQSQEMELKPGDRIVVQLHNASAPRYFMLLFVATDKQQQISFPHTTLKLLPDPESKDFTAAQFAAFNKHAKENKGRTNQPFPYKNRSEWVWGEADISTLGSLLTREMFIPMHLQ